ncbi:MAG: MarR family transcriptional regulator [Leptospiraceae bacterium]|nr:MarR family transcriptional regulator [Leptospiraceae bacterium]
MGTKYIGTQEEILSLNSYITLLRASDTISYHLNSQLNKNKLTLSQFGVLESLYHLGPMCQKAISTKILKSTANITTVIDNLEKRDLVKRVRQEDDRRYITVHLTDTGSELIAEILPGHLSEIFKIMNTLTNSEKEILYNLCKKLGTSSLISEKEEKIKLN